MLLTVLGCSGGLPGPDAAASGYLLESDGFRLVVDFGSGALAALQTRCDAFEVDALLLSRLCPDHCSDLTALTVLRRYHPDPPYDTTARRLPVHAPGEAPDRFARAYAENADELARTDLSDVFDFRPLVEGTIHIGPFEVVSAHDAGGRVFGFRITSGGVSLAYTGLTLVLPLAAGVDLLLAEAGRGGCPGTSATEAGVGRVLLTHIEPWADHQALLAHARAGFAGPVELARQGESYRIG